MTTDHSKSYFLDFWHHCAISSYVVVSGNNVEIMCLCWPLRGFLSCSNAQPFKLKEQDRKGSREQEVEGKLNPAHGLGAVSEGAV